jgi:hypothetical protein
VELEQVLNQLSHLPAHSFVGRAFQRRDQFLHPAEPFLEFLRAGLIHGLLLVHRALPISCASEWAQKVTYGFSSRAAIVDWERFR